METIIENIKEYFDESTLKESASKFIRFNNKIKKIGIKRIVLPRYYMNEDLICKELTLFIFPSYNLSEYWNRSVSRNGFTSLYNHIISLGGSPSFYDYKQLRPEAFDSQERLKISYEGKDYEIGDYIKERNIIITCLPFEVNCFSKGRSDEYLKRYTDWIVEALEKVKLEEVDTSKLSNALIIRKYNKLIEDRIKLDKSEIFSCERDIESFREGIIRSTSKYRNAKLTLAGLMQVRDNVEENIFKQVEGIRSLKFVKDVQFNENGIVLFFNKIYIKVKEKDIEMGEYKVTLFPNRIIITNLQPVVYQDETYHSPHIREDNVCYGEKSDYVADLLGALNLKKLTHFLYLFLSSYNPEDTYLSMNYWIKGKENGGVCPSDFHSEEDDEDEHSGDAYCDKCENYMDAEDYNYNADMCFSCFNAISIECLKCKRDFLPENTCNGICDSCADEEKE